MSWLIDVLREPLAEVVILAAAAAGAFLAGLVRGKRGAPPHGVLPPADPPVGKR